MCDNLTYRSAGAETLVRMNTINILLRWSKEGVLGYVGTAFVQLNSLMNQFLIFELTLFYFFKDVMLDSGTWTDSRTP